jgi:hypothetical protein
MYRLSGAVVFSLLLVGCTLLAQEGATKSTPYYPLKKGASWTYKTVGGEVVMKVIDEKEGKFKIETTAGGKATAVEVVGPSEQGLVRYEVNGLKSDAPVLFFKWDAKEKDEWLVDTKVSGQSLKGKFTTKNAKVTVPAGTYDALVVEAKDLEVGGAKSNVTYHFAKDVGIVKLSFAIGGQDIALELLKYEPGK